MRPAVLKMTKPTWSVWSENELMKALAAVLMSPKTGETDPE